MPLAGEAVTETVAPAGRNSAWSSAFLRGPSSNVGARHTPARAADLAGVTDETPRYSPRAATPEHGPDQLIHRKAFALEFDATFAQPGEVEQVADQSVHALRLVLQHVKQGSSRRIVEMTLRVVAERRRGTE